MAKTKAKNKRKAKKKGTEHLRPRITLQSPAADVVRVIGLIVKSYKLTRPIDLEQAVRFIDDGISTSIHTYFFEFEAPIIDRVCDWLRHNRKDDLYVPVCDRWRNLQNLIEKTDQFILDALEKKGLNHILLDTGTNDNLRRLFVSIKHFAAILEDTATALGKSREQKSKKQKRWTPEEIQNAINIYESKCRKYNDAGDNKTQKQVYDEVAKEMDFTTVKNPGEALRKAIVRHEDKESRRRGVIFKGKSDK